MRALQNLRHYGVGLFGSCLAMVAHLASFLRLRRKGWRVVLPFMVIALAFSGFSLLLMTRPETRPSKNLERVWPVAALDVERVTYVPHIRAFGELRARRQIDLRTQVAGEVIVTSEQFENGSRVGANDVLLQIDPFHYEAALRDAEAQLKGANAVLAERKAAIIQAENDWRRTTELAKKGTVSQKTLDDRTTELTIQKARHDQQQAVVDRAGVARDRARRDLANTKLTAPFNAHISNIAARKGRVLNPNDRVATLSDADAFEIIFNLSDADYGRFLARNADIIGQHLAAVWALGSQSVKLQAEIRRVGANISQSTRGVDVYARVLGAVPSNLRGGAFVTIDLQSRPVPDVMVVPRRAVYGDNQVFVVVHGRLETRKLEKFIDLGNVLLVSEGLAVHDKLLVTRFNEAAPGVSVKIIDEGNS